MMTRDYMIERGSHDEAVAEFLHWVMDGGPLTTHEERELHGEAVEAAEPLPVAA